MYSGKISDMNANDLRKAAFLKLEIDGSAGRFHILSRGENGDSIEMQHDGLTQIDTIIGISGNDGTLGALLIKGTAPSDAMPTVGAMKSLAQTLFNKKAGLEIDADGYANYPMVQDMRGPSEVFAILFHQNGTHVKGIDLGTLGIDLKDAQISRILDEESGAVGIQLTILSKCKGLYETDLDIELLPQYHADAIKEALGDKPLRTGVNNIFTSSYKGGSIRLGLYGTEDANGNNVLDANIDGDRIMMDTAGSPVALIRDMYDTPNKILVMTEAGKIFFVEIDIDERSCTIKKAASVSGGTMIGYTAVASESDFPGGLVSIEQTAKNKYAFRGVSVAA